MADDDVTEITPEEQAENSEEKPSCSVCFNTFHSKNRVPKCLSCGHSFCQQCIISLLALRPYQHNLSCPTCRKCSAMPSCANVSSIPTNFVLKEMLEKYETTETLSQGNSYACMNCRVDYHEKDMLLCAKCTPRDGSQDSVDFMGRSSRYLICSSCIKSRHAGHSYESTKNVSARWAYRSIFQKFEKSAEAETERIDKLIKTLNQTTEATLKFKDNLLETVRQVKNNAATRNISSVIRNFVKAANDSSKFLNMTTMNIERVNHPSAPQHKMLGKELFTKKNHLQSEEASLEYASQLAKHFSDLDKCSSPSSPNSVSQSIGNKRVQSAAPQPALDGPLQQAAMNTPANRPIPMADNPPPPQILNRLQQMELDTFHRFRHVTNPPLHPFSSNELNKVMDYYGMVNAQLQAQFVEMISFNAQIPFQEFARRRREIVEVSILHGEFLNRRRSLQLQDLFALPFHLFNVNLPQLYRENVGEVLLSFVNEVLANGGGREVHDHFFIPPYDKKMFSTVGRQHILKVLTKMINVVGPGVYLHTILSRMKFRHENNRFLRIAQGGVNNIVPNQDDDLIIIEDFTRVIASPRRELHVDEVVVQRVDEEEDDVMPRLQVEIDDEDIIVIPQQDDEQPNNERLQRDAQLDEEIEQLQRQPRNNYVFQIEDLLIEPPARATRAAKRRADSAHPPVNQRVSSSEPSTSEPSSGTNNQENGPTARKRPRH